MAATIRDIAKKLNISVSTVSYALNGGPRPVPEHVRAAVLDAARELKYRPNRLAKSMVTGRTDTIGVILPEVFENIFLGPFIQLVLNGIANEAGNSHRDILIYTRKNKTDRDEMMSVILDGRADGVMFLSPLMSHQTVEIATSLHIPCVVISGRPIKGLTTFSVDNVDGMEKAMSHLWNLGHRRIAHIAGNLNMHDGLERLDTYRDFLHAKGEPVRDEYIANGAFQVWLGAEAMGSFLKLPEPPTAVVAANDEMALGAMERAQEMGVRIPQDISLVGFDGTPAAASSVPRLTTVKQPITEIGGEAFKALVSIIEGRPVPESTKLKTSFDIGKTTARPTEDSLNHEEKSVYAH